MITMKKETVEIIRGLMKRDVEDRKDRVWHLIVNGFDQGLSERIAELRAALKAQDDFDDWADAMED